MATIKHDLSNAKVWDGTLLKDLVVPVTDLRQRKVPYPWALNPHHSIGEESSEWAYANNSPTPIHQERLESQLLNVLSAYVFPNAPAEKLRIMNDMSMWFSVYDDVIDDADKLGEGYSEECKSLDTGIFEYLEGLQTGKPLAEMPDLLLSNVGMKALVDFIDRFRKQGLSEDQIHIMCQGFIQFGNCNRRIATEELTLEEYVKERRLGIGMRSYTVLMEWGNGFSMSPQLRRHPIAQEMITCCEDYISLTNDIHSLPKEVLFEPPTENNLVRHLMKLDKCSVQEAMYEVLEVSLVALNDLDMVIDCIAESELAEEEKALLYRYGEASREMCAGYAQWAFDTPRYNTPGMTRKLVSPDTTANDKYKLRPACQWLREKYILKLLTQEICPDRDPVSNRAKTRIAA